jgi:hypothetical protein
VIGANDHLKPERNESLDEFLEAWVEWISTSAPFQFRAETEDIEKLSTAGLSGGQNGTKDEKERQQMNNPAAWSQFWGGNKYSICGFLSRQSNRAIRNAPISTALLLITVQDSSPFENREHNESDPVIQFHLFVASNKCASARCWSFPLPMNHLSSRWPQVHSHVHPCDLPHDQIKEIRQKFTFLRGDRFCDLSFSCRTVTYPIRSWAFRIAEERTPIPGTLRQWLNSTTQQDLRISVSMIGRSWLFVWLNLGFPVPWLTNEGRNWPNHFA